MTAKKEKGGGNQPKSNPEPPSEPVDSASQAGADAKQPKKQIVEHHVIYHQC